MKRLHFFDTNILIYSISADPFDASKRKRAIELLDEDRGALSIQVLQEFYLQSTRATRLNPLSHEEAVRFITDWSRFAVQEVTMRVLKDALELRATRGYSYWDSAIIAAARELGCTTLYSEDMKHGHEVVGVLIINPFR